MSTKRSAGRGVSTQERVRSKPKSKKDRSPNLCAFAFADGRQCRTPRCSGHLHFCYFHAQKEAESLAAQQVGEDISRFLPTKLLTACDLGAAMSRLFCAVAQGQIKPKVASTLAYLAQTMLQSIPIAQHEYIESFNTNTWRSAVRVSFRQEDEANTPASARKTNPQPPASASAPPTAVEAGRNSSRLGREPGASSSSASPTAPQPPAQPATSPHTPLPPTRSEFAQQVMAGLNSSRSEVPPPSAPARDPRSSGSPSSSISSSASSSPDSAPAHTSSTQPAPSSPARQPSPSKSQPASAPSAPQSTSPQQSQPTQNSQHNPHQRRRLPSPRHAALVPPPTGTS